ncbi:MAG: acyl-CoA thioesterase [Verrucomicrobiaceae bacterium]|nr:acyl-CoA thioesterase [Verrucomicrobiaceae bacterium]
MEASIKIKVPFYDLDPMNVVWHGNYVKYFEQARCALLNELQFNYPEMAKMGYAFPVVKMEVKYIRPSEFEQEILVKAKLVDSENYLHVKYLITDAVTGAKICEAQTKQMCVSLTKKTSYFELPTEVLKKLKSI